jgi:hypothetical protein
LQDNVPHPSSTPYIKGLKLKINPNIHSFNNVDKEKHFSEKEGQRDRERREKHTERDRNRELDTDGEREKLVTQTCIWLCSSAYSMD